MTGSAVEAESGVLTWEVERRRDFRLDLKLWEERSFLFLIGGRSSGRTFMLTSCRQPGAESDLFVKLCRGMDLLEVTLSRSFWRVEGIFMFSRVEQV